MGECVTSATISSCDCKPTALLLILLLSDTVGRTVNQSTAAHGEGCCRRRKQTKQVLYQKFIVFSTQANSTCFYVTFGLFKYFTFCKKEVVGSASLLISESTVEKEV